MNTDYPTLKDIRVRKAIQRAIDVDSIIQAAYAGVSAKAYGVVPPGILGHRTASKYSYKPDEARALLKEAGVSDLTLEIKTLPDQQYTSAAQVIQANLADVGIKVKIIPVDSGPFWNLGLEKKGDDWKTLQLWIMRFRCSPDPSDAIQWFKKDQVGVWNWERWSNPEFEDLWNKGLAERDTKKRERDLSAHAGDHGGYRRLRVDHARAVVLYPPGRPRSRFRYRRRDADRALQVGLTPGMDAGPAPLCKDIRCERGAGQIARECAVRLDRLHPD